MRVNDPIGVVWEAKITHRATGPERKGTQMSYNERVENGELVEVIGTARIGNGTKRHRATKVVIAATGRTHSIDIEFSCAAGSSRSRFVGAANGWLPTETAPLTCGHCATFGTHRRLEGRA